MAILVKGIDMPKHDDEYVIFTVYGDGGVVYGPLNRPHVRYKNRAVPVPKSHGRLGDLDELKTAFPCGESIRTESVRATIDHMLTIIPASEEAE